MNTCLALCVAAGAMMVAAAGAQDGHVTEGLLLNWEASARTEGFTLRGDAAHRSDPACVEFSGQGAVVAAAPQRPERVTIEAMFRVDRRSGPLQLVVTTFPPEVRRVSGAKGNSRQWVLEIRGDPPQGPKYMGFLEFGIFGEDQQWHLAASDRRIARGWHHAVGTFDGGRVRLYLDGKEQTRRLFGRSPEFVGKLNQPPDGVVNLPAFGSNSLRIHNGFEGALALARMYDRALTAGQIARHFARAKERVPAVTEHKPPRAATAKPAFKVLYSNDFTNLHVISPYHKKGEPFRPSQLRASVAEAAGSDVHMLQPAHGWVPWWPSKLYTMQEHHRWWAAHYGLDPKNLRAPGVHQYILDGGDPFKDFIDECHRVGQQAFISLRLNDRHHLAHAGTPKNRRGMHAISRFYVEHPEYRIGRGGTGHDWSIPEARNHKLAFIREICENYDIAGFELDFMRFPHFFKDTVPLRQRERIITGFVGDVRAILDRTAKPGQHRWLSARVPCLLDQHADPGIDLVEMVDVGLDMVNLSPHYYTVQQTDVAAVRERLPDAAIYLEMCHCTMQGEAVGVGGDSRLFMRTTDAQYYTTAHLAYRRGADGVSLFNFVYTREHGVPGRGPFNEPPFHVLKRLGDPAWLAQQPQWYVFAHTSMTPLSQRFDKGDAYTFKLDMAPTEHQRREGIFRLMTKEDSSSRQWMVKVNGATLPHRDFIRKPLDHPYDAGLGAPENYVCFTCPPALVRDGLNRVAIVLENGKPATVQYLDLVLP